jgi:hypothetical protein
LWQEGRFREQGPGCKVLSELVARLVVTHYKEEELIYARKQMGDLPYSWMYEVTVRSNGLYLCGNFQESTTQQAVIVNGIPNLMAQHCEYGWYEVYCSANDSSAVCVFRGAYANGLKALLSSFRGHVDAMENAVSAARDSLHFHRMKTAMDEDRERKDLDYMHSL